MRSGVKRCVFTFALLAIMLIVVEIALTVLAAVSPRIAQLVGRPAPLTVDDTALGHRPSPDHPDHDAKGFRNPSVPTDVDIVALGDSQTYGTGVAQAEAWPLALASRTDHAVYSMAFGGYGPAHSRALWDEAMELKPEIVVEAFYAGNDLFDSFKLVQLLGQQSDLRTQDESAQAAVEQRESDDPIEDRVLSMFRFGREDTSKSSAPGFVRAIARRMKLYGLFRNARSELRRRRRAPAPSTEAEAWQQARAFANANAAYCSEFERGDFRTIFTPEYRYTALNPDDPRIVEGRNIALNAIRDMQTRANANGIRFVVILIPTKEIVFADLVGDDPEIGAAYHNLLTAERTFWSIVTSALDDAGIEYVDMLPALRACLEDGRQPYKVDYDGHPNPIGHAAIADQLAEYLAR